LREASPSGRDGLSDLRLPAPRADRDARLRESVTAEIRAATPADSPGIRRLFAKVFGVGMTAEEWDWKFLRNPDGWFGVVADLGGEIVGNYAGWAMRFTIAGREKILYSVGDVATDPSVRTVGGRRGLYRRMAEAFYENVFARGVPFCFGFPNGRALEISHRLVGSRTLFPVREVRVPCDSFPEAPSGGAAADFVGEPFDPLWQEASRHLAWAAVRDRARANWRFHARPTRYYRMVWRDRGEGIESWGCLSVVGDNATVVDFLGRQPDGSDLSALFALLAAEARRMGASTLVLWETPGGPGRQVIANLPGERRDAGFPLIVKTSDDLEADQFARSIHFTPALYDVV
jgi:GNAT acetyltransferase-like protein